MVKKSTTINTNLRDILTLLVLCSQIVQKRLNLKKCPGGKLHVTIPISQKQNRAARGALSTTMMGACGRGHILFGTRKEVCVNADDGERERE